MTETPEGSPQAAVIGIGSRPSWPGIVYLGARPTWIRCTELNRNPIEKIELGAKQLKALKALA